MAPPLESLCACFLTDSSLSATSMSIWRLCECISLSETRTSRLLCPPRMSEGYSAVAKTSRPERRHVLANIDKPALSMPCPASPATFHEKSFKVLDINNIHSLRESMPYYRRVP